MTDVINNNRLQSFMYRLNNQQDVKDAARDDFNEILAEAKADGYDPRILRKILRKMRADPNKVREEAEVTALYESALGMEG